MKFFIAFLLVAACIEQCLSATVEGQLNEAEHLESLRIKKSAKGYGSPAPTISAPPCPKSYLFSCGPQLQPVPCAQGGYQGSYSENVPQYIAPQYVVPQQYAYPQYAFPVVTEV